MNKTHAISYLHSSNNKRTEPFDSWEQIMVITSLHGIYSVTVQGHASKSRECVVQSTLRTQHSWVAWVDSKESRRLRTWAKAQKSPSLNTPLDSCCMFSIILRQL